MTTSVSARTPEDLTRLFVERANAGDADGLAALYAPDAVMACRYRRSCTSPA